MAIDDRFEYARLPIKPLPYSMRDRAHHNEIMIDYGESEDNKYHIYIAHPTDLSQDPIDITTMTIEEVLNSKNIDASGYFVNLGANGTRTIGELFTEIYGNTIRIKDDDGFNINRDYALLNPLSTDTITAMLSSNSKSAVFPVTLASNVYIPNTTGGNPTSVQEALSSASKLGFTITNLYANDESKLRLGSSLGYAGLNPNKRYQTEFTFKYPFANYTDLMDIRVGTVFIANDRYNVTPTYDGVGSSQYSSGTITFTGDIFIEEGRRIDILWIYNDTGSANNSSAISGNNIVNSSISIDKLARHSNDYIFADKSCVATTAALNALYNTIVNMYDYRENSIKHLIDTGITNTNTIICSMSSAEENNFNAANSIIYVTPACDKSNCKIKINNRTYNMVKCDGSAYVNLFKGVQVKLVGRLNSAGDDIELVVANGNYSRINKSTVYFDCTSDETSNTNIISPDADIDVGALDTIDVYRNGIKLFELLDYTYTITPEPLYDEANPSTINNINRRITLNLSFKTKKGDRYVIETTSLRGGED